jgi:hypothetical protein
MRPLPSLSYGASQRVRLKPFFFLAELIPLKMTRIEKKALKQVSNTSKAKSPVSHSKESEEVEVKMEESKVRYLKLQTCYREKREDYFNIKTTKVPDLRLRGNCLEAAGFYVDEYVSVTVSKGVLIIRPKAI